jgi:hypothetical protein
MRIAEPLCRLAGSFMLDPRKSVRRSWDFTVMFVVLYTACAVPYDTAFSPPVGAVRSRFELAVTAVFAVDILLNFFTGRVEKTGSCLLALTTRRAASA